MRYFLRILEERRERRMAPTFTPFRREERSWLEAITVSHDLSGELMFVGLALVFFLISIAILT